MALEQLDYSRLEIKGLTATVTLARADVHNAFNAEMMDELTKVFKELDQDDRVRVVVIAAEGKSFSAGADLNWMKSMVDYSFDENVNDSMRLGELFKAIYLCSKPVIAKVQGAAIGGGLGIVAACDMVAALDAASFRLSEVKLGLMPAVIAPFIMRKIAPTYAARYFVTAEPFNAETAYEMGLVSEVCMNKDGLDKQVAEWAERLCQNGPQAMAHAKRMVQELASASKLDDELAYSIKQIADRRVSSEGQEGVRAFLEKREARFS